MNSKSMSKRQTLWMKLRDPEYRDAFVSSTVAARIAVRIHNLRQKLGWTQTILAEKAGMKQARISLLEQADYENFSFNTLKRIAAAFKVAVIVDFVSFPDFVKWSNDFDSVSAAPQSFDETQVNQTTQWLAAAITGESLPTNDAVLRHILADAFISTDVEMGIPQKNDNTLLLPTRRSPVSGAALAAMSPQ